MSDTINSQVQQAGAMWKAFLDDQITRMTSILDEVGKLQVQGVEQAQTAIDEVTRLGKESIAWSAELTSSWRRLTVETTRRAAEFVSHR